MNHEQLEKHIEAEVSAAVDILDRLAGLPQDTTNLAHRLLVEKIINAALLQTALTQAQAMSSAGKENNNE
jgi:hypothetical protein